MTPKENLLAVLRHQEPEWIPWIPVIEIGVNIPAFIPSELRVLEPALQRNLKICEYFAGRFGADVLIRNGRLLEAEHHSVKVTQERDGNILKKRIETRAGTLTSKQEETFYGDSLLITSRITEHLVKCPGDFEPLKCYIQDITYKLNEERFGKLVNQVGEKGLVCTGAPGLTPIMDLIIAYMGLENFIYALSDCRSELEDVMEIMGDKYLEGIRLIAGSSAQAILFSDDANTLMISPGLFEKYSLPFIRKCTEISRRAGKVFLYHTCGKVRGLLGLIQRSGIDAHEYLNQPPVGDTPFTEAKSLWGDSICIMGAVDPVLMEKGKPEEIRRYLLKLLKEMSPGRNFILETSSKPSVPEQNVKVVAEVMKESHRYPLNI